MARLLIVDDDAITAGTFAYALEMDGYEVRTAATGSEGIQLAVGWHPSAAVVDLQLPDMSGLDVLRSLRTEVIPQPSVVILTGFGTARNATDAMKLGAREFLEKPIDINDFVHIIRTIVSDCDVPPGPSVAEQTRHAARRWAEIVIKVIDSPSDIRTLREWGRWIAVSSGALRNWCRTVGISPKRSLNFARLLRATYRQRPSDKPQDLLDMVDLRTLRHMLQLGRNGGSRSSQLPVSVEHYISNQNWILDPGVLAEVRKLLASKTSVAGDNAAQASAGHLNGV